jgi:RNA polymerase sigma-70 factor (sigma-E family)
VLEEPQGFRDYVAARQRALLRIALMLTGHQHTAEDLVQATLERVWPRWERIVRAGDPDRYVRRVMINTYSSWWQRKWRAERSTSELPETTRLSETTSADDDFAHADLSDALRRIMPTLTPKQRAVLVLRYYDDLTEAATAEVLGCSVGTVKSQTAKALARLRLMDDPRVTEAGR